MPLACMVCGMKREKLEKVLENHKLWLNNDCENMKSDLYYADLRYEDLSYADLSHVDLRYANLSNADLRGSYLLNANLRYANLSNADLRYANLRYANLSNADLRYADLRYADLSHADLRYADLSGSYLLNANLHYAELSNANLINANLSCADLYCANLLDTNFSFANLYCAALRGAKNVPFIPYACPELGSFIGYKKASGYIIEIEILADSNRLSATSRKCRCNKAKVLRILNFDKTVADVTEVRSSYDSNFIYKVGNIVSVDNFDEDRWNECSTGIHFFINFKEAVDY